MSNERIVTLKDSLSFEENINGLHEKHGLRGHVTIIRENVKTGESGIWYEEDNIIPISGYQWILLKMFGLHLDSSHNVSYENIGQDSTVIIPDLNNAGSYQLGVDPKLYSPMNEDISSQHFIQGFMVGNGGAGEDAITSKNTNYSFTRLRNPIPFQQSSGSIVSEKGTSYLGVLRNPGNVRSYYIKRFDERPHIYHSWWKNGQKWDYLDPVTQNDLGPNAVNGAGKTNRIETYAECKMSLDESDCLSYFQHEGSTQTAAINELGLVAFDSLFGSRSIIEKLYNEKIKQFIKICFDKNRTIDDAAHAHVLAREISLVLQEQNITSYNQININTFTSLVTSIANLDNNTNIDFDSVMSQLSAENNIEVESFYNQSGSFIYATDKFLKYMSDPAFDGMGVDEAQRIKLITYFTFNSIPLQEDWRMKINYRIYAN